MDLLFLIQASLIWVFKSRLEGPNPGQQSEFRQNTYRLLKYIKTWDDMSNNKRGTGHYAFNSLEAIHDSIHGAIGGHMGDTAVAGSYFTILCF